MTLALLALSLFAQTVTSTTWGPSHTNTVYVLPPAVIRPSPRLSASSNFAADLLGPIDARPGCYGNADSLNFTLTFNPPSGSRVHVLRLRGDLVAWPRVLPGETPIAPGKYAGVLLGFQTTAPEGSKSCDWCADNTMLYIQDATAGEPRRATFDADVTEGGLLERDGKLVVKVAAWLNTTGRAIHLEPTFTVVYRYERER